MRSMTLFFWLKFIIYISAVMGLTYILNLYCPYESYDMCTRNNMTLSFLICSPILVCNQIYRLIRRKTLITRTKEHKLSKSWVRENVNNLREVYENKFVGIHNGQVIDSDEDLNALKKRLRDESIPLKKIRFEFIHPKEDQDELDNFTNK